MQNISFVQGTGRTGQISQVQEQSNDAAVQKALSGLKDGQTIQGRVVSAQMNPDGSRTAQIAIGDHAVVSARLNGDMSLQEGSNVSFQVRGTTSGTVTLRPLYENTAADPNVMKALSAAGLSTGDSMQSMVRSMMEQGMSIDRSALLAMSRTLAEHPTSPVSTLVQMSRLQIPLTEGNIQQFQNYQNYEHQVTTAVGSILEELPDAFSRMMQSGKTDAAMDLYGDLMKLFSGDPTGSAEGIPGSMAQDAPAVAQETPANPMQTQENGENAAVSDLPDGTIEGQAPAQATRQDIPASVKVVVSDLPVPGESKAESGSTVKLDDPLQTNAQLTQSKEAVTQPADDGLAFLKALAGQNQKGGAAVSDAISGALKAIQQQSTQQTVASATSNPELVRQNLPELIRGLNLPPEAGEQVKALLQGQGNLTEADSAMLLKTLSDAYQQTAHQSPATDAAWGKLFSSREFTGLLQERISGQWLLKPQDVESRDAVEKLYQRLHEQTRSLTQMLSGPELSGTAVANSVQNLSQNLDFMNQMNQMFSYVQLPLKMADGKANGDLYVYTNKKNLAHEDGSVSAILHLDMAHLGPLDVYVKMRDNHVNTNFYLANDAAMDLIEAHMDELNRRLEKRGYSMQVRVLHQADKASENTAVDELLQKGEKLSLVSETSFNALA